MESDIADLNAQGYQMIRYYSL